MEQRNKVVTETINIILKELIDESMVSLTKSDSRERHDAINKMNAYNLIEEKSRGTYKLTQEGYNAAELGHFDKWVKSQKSSTGGTILKYIFDHILVVIGTSLIIAFIVYYLGWNK